MRNLAKLLKDEHILGLTNVHFEKDRICKACQAGKQVGAPHPPNSILTTSSTLELIHMDLFGPVAYISIGGNKYGLVIVDDYSHFTWVFFVFDKSEVQGKVKTFIRRAQREFELLLTNKRRIHLRSASVRTYTFFTTGFPRFLSIHGARGLQAFDLPLLTNY
jgi:hypothetical protein